MIGIACLFVFISFPWAPSGPQITLYISRCEVSEGEELDCVLEVANCTPEARTLYLPVDFQRREQRPGKAPKPRHTNNGLGTGPLGKRVWVVSIECWAPYPARNGVLNVRGFHQPIKLEVPAKEAVTFKVTVPSKAFEAGVCKIQASLIENREIVASSRVLALDVKKK